VEAYGVYGGVSWMGDGWSLWRPRSEGVHLRTEGGNLEIDSVDLWGRRYDDCVSWGEVCMSGGFVSTEERFVSVGLSVVCFSGIKVCVLSLGIECGCLFSPQNGLPLPIGSGILKTLYPNLPCFPNKGVCIVSQYRVWLPLFPHRIDWLFQWRGV
jgi:hypothetical protein